MENHAYGEVIGSPQAPYLNRLARQGALFTDSRAITHPSEPNYLALFSGSTQGVSDDSCPHQFSAPNLGSELIAAGRTFTGYSESLPAAGSSGLRERASTRANTCPGPTSAVCPPPIASPGPPSRLVSSRGCPRCPS